MTYKDHIQRILKYLFWGILIALILLLFISWVLSIYVDGVQGLLTTRGIRWMCANIIPNFSTVHIAKILLGLMAMSVLRASGILKACRSHISLKQRRALQITGGPLWSSYVCFLFSCYYLTLCCSAHLAPFTIRPFRRGSLGCWLVLLFLSAMCTATLQDASRPCVTLYKPMPPSSLLSPTIL